VILGRTKQVSADWPGAAASELESLGHKAIVFQGFCGDIDPVSNLNRWGEGTKEDLLLYGNILAKRAMKSERSAKKAENVRLRAQEKRIRIPLAVCPRDQIEGQAKSFLETNKGFPFADRFAGEWEKTAHQLYDDCIQKPYLDNIPLQVLSIGKIKILAVPGEAFAQFGLDLRNETPSLFTFGYANGNIGYLPSSQAFRDPEEYACYCAPKFYTVFPFTADLEDLLMRESRALLRL
jgi:hypothetical protein